MCAKAKTNDECEEFEREIASDATFAFPRNISERVVLGKHLIIAPEHANWLAYDDEEYGVFCLFRSGKSIQEIGDALRGQGMNPDRAMTIVSQVVAQILGKEFEQKATATEKETLKVASLLLTAGCNLRCSICRFKATVAGPNECSFDSWRRFLKAFANMGGETITLTGGEPMTSPNFNKIVTCAKDLGLRVVVLTNGTLVTKQNAKFLGKNCDEIQVSIDGPNAETHDSVRGKGAFKKTISALKELSVYSSCHLSIAMTPTLTTLPVFQVGLHRFAEKVWTDISPNISIRVSRTLVGGRKISCLSDEEQETYESKVIALCDDQLEVGFVDKLDSVAIVPNRRNVGCGVGEYFSIMADGEIKLCEFFPDSFGNIRNIGEDGNFLRTVAERVREIAHSFAVEELSPCRQCDLRYFCGGKCRKDNKRYCGSPNVCKCDDVYKNSWYERLVRISPYIVQPLT